MLILNTWSIWAKVLCKQMILLRWSYLYQETNSLKGRLTVVLFLGLLCYFLFFFFCTDGWSHSLIHARQCCSELWHPGTFWSNWNSVFIMSLIFIIILKSYLWETLLTVIFLAPDERLLLENGSTKRQTLCKLLCQNLQNVRITHFILNCKTKKIKIPNRILGL